MLQILLWCMHCSSRALLPLQPKHNTKTMQVISAEACVTTGRAGLPSAKLLVQGTDGGLTSANHDAAFICFTLSHTVQIKRHWQLRDAGGVFLPACIDATIILAYMENSRQFFYYCSQFFLGTRANASFTPPLLILLILQPPFIVLNLFYFFLTILFLWHILFSNLLCPLTFCDPVHFPPLVRGQRSICKVL